MNEKDCFDDFNVGFGFGVSRVPLASSRPSLWLPWPLRFKMRGLLNSQLSFPNFNIIDKIQSSMIPQLPGNRFRSQSGFSISIVNVERKLSFRGAKQRACTPKWRYGTQAWQSHEIASLRSQ